MTNWPLNGQIVFEYKVVIKTSSNNSFLRRMDHNFILFFIPLSWNRFLNKCDNDVTWFYNEGITLMTSLLHWTGFGKSNFLIQIQSHKKIIINIWEQKVFLFLQIFICFVVCCVLFPTTFFKMGVFIVEHFLRMKM